MALRHTLLGLLILHPRTGYDLHKRMEHATFLLESASLRRIYPTLKKLHDEKLVTFHVEPQEGKPDRKVYAVTDAGEAVFLEWLQKPPKPDLMKLDHLFARFFFYGMLDKATILTHLQAALDQRRRLLAKIKDASIAPPAGPCRPIVDNDRVMVTWEAMRDYGRTDTETQIHWLELTIQIIDQKL